MTEPTRGYLVPIGGAESKDGEAAILQRFVDLCGGSSARIVIVPTASKLDDTGPRYESILAELGAGSTRSLAFRSRRDGHREAWIDEMTRATGVFLTGGSQLRLSRTLGGTPAAKALRAAYHRGTHVAGTSAGASYLSEHMIAFGDQGASPVTHMVAMASGIGLTSDFTIDQHFGERDRLGRLLTAVAYNPAVVGMGLDENTAAFIAPNGQFEVVGVGSCTLVDGADMEYASIGTKPGDPVCMLGVRLHILVPGSRYDIVERRPIAPDEGPDREVQPL